MKIDFSKLTGWIFAFVVIAIISTLYLQLSKHGENGVLSVDKASKDKSFPTVLRFGHDMHSDSAQHETALQFADLVDFKSNGRVKIQVFPSQELGTDHQMLADAQAGKLAIILTPTAKLSTLVPSAQLVDLPFLFENREACYAFLDGIIGQEILDNMLPHGLVGVTFWESGFKQFTTNRRVTTPEDFRGLKIRAMKSRVVMEQFRSLGAYPIPIDFSKTFQALKDGVVDGQENPLSSIVTMEFYKVQSHITISNHAYLGQVLSFSKKILDSLPEDIRAILVTTARELTLMQRKSVILREKGFLEKIKAAGVDVATLSSDEKQEFQKVTQKIMQKLREQIGPEIVDKTTRFIADRKHDTGNSIVIGLDADMHLGSAPSGNAILRGMELAVDEINREGGIMNRSVKILVRDNSGISARGVANLKFFAKEKNLVAVVGGLHSPVALSELKTIHKEKIVYLDPWAAATGIVDNGFNPNYVFRVSVRDEYAGAYLVDQALKLSPNIALLLENTGWGRSNHRAMTKALAEHKRDPVAVEWFNWGKTDLSLQLSSIERANAGVILLVANAPEGIAVIKEMAVRSQKIPLISHWGITGGSFWKDVNRELSSVDLRFLQTFSFQNPRRLEARKLLEHYLSKYQKKSWGSIIAPAGTAHAYDLVHLLAKAIKQAGNLNRSDIRNALEKIESYVGVVRTYSPPFTPGRHDALDRTDFITARFNSLGYIVPVEKD